MSVPRISRDTLKARLEAESADPRPLLVDARLKYPYEHSTLTLPGAVRVDPSAIDSSQLPRDRELVIYDSDPGEVVAAEVAVALARAGFRVSVLAEGLPGWIGASLPTEAKAGPPGPAAESAAGE